MKQKVTRMGLALALAATIAPQAFSADPILSFDFEYTSAEGEVMFTNAFNVLNHKSNADTNIGAATYNWYYYNTGSTPYKYARCYSYDISNFDDYLYTKEAYNLEPGHAYRVKLQSWCDNTNGSGKLTIMCGTEESPLVWSIASQTYTVDFINKYYGGEGEWITYDFSVPAAGAYYLGFHSQGFGACLDNITLTDMGSATAPAAVSDLTVTPAADFSAKATVSCTLPDKCVVETNTLDNITKVEVYRAGELAATVDTGLTPGAAFSWTDNSAPEGNVTYGVKVYNGTEASQMAEATAYVGPLTPKPVTGLTVTTTNDRDFNISWTAVTKAVNDMNLEASLIKYNVYRVIGENATKVADAISETSYADSYSATEPVELSYRVEVAYGTKTSEPVSSETFLVGPYSLPLSASFANATMDTGWKAEKIKGDTNWKPQASGDYPSTQPQDEDGGMLWYNSYNSSKQNSARLISPEIINAEGDNAAISFYVKHAIHRSYADLVYVDIQKDGGEWEQVEGSEIKIETDENNEWTQYNFPLKSLLAGTERYRVGIRAVSGYGWNTSIDNVKIYNMVAKDLEVSKVAGPETILAGNQATYNVTVSNQGADAVEAADYQVELSINGVQKAVVDGVALAPNSSNVFEIPVELTAPEAGEAALPVVVKVVYAADMVADNNEAQTQINVSTSQNPTPLNEAGRVDGDNIILTWDCPINLDGFTETNINEDFATWTSATEETAAETNGWTVLDNDGEDAKSSYWYGFSNEYWSVVTTNGSSYAPTPSVGKMVGVTNSNLVTSDDWLISPELNPYEGMTYQVSLRYIFNDTNSDVSVRYSDTDKDPASFQTAAEVPIAYPSAEWKEFTCEVPGTAKYIAIHYTTDAYNYTRAVALDYVKIKSNMAVVNGYHVYEDGARLNGEMLTETSYIIPLTEARSADNERSFAISAVYNEGESALSPLVTVSIPTGIDGIINDLAGIRVLRGGISVPSFARVYGVNGTQVASGEGFISLSRGLYVVTLNGHAYKVMVK